MKVLIACEESQTVCKAFRAKGHEANSPQASPPQWRNSGAETLGRTHDDKENS